MASPRRRATSTQSTGPSEQFSRHCRSTQVDNRMFALIAFGIYCVVVFFIILSMFFAMVSAAQEAVLTQREK